jgi:hypothetical protein
LRRLQLFLVVIGFAIFGCTVTPTEVANAPTATLQGPIVPTRAPTSTEELAATGAETPTETPAAIAPSATLDGVTAQASVPTASATHTQVVPTDTSAPTETLAPTATLTATRASTATETAPPSATATPLPSETPQPSPTATLTSTPTTPAPTDTLQPTSTTAPTQTPIPTETPVSSAVYTDSTAFVPVTLESAVTAFSTVTGSIDNAHPARLYTYNGLGGESLNIEMRKLAGDLDPFLIVIDPKGRELVRNDDETSESLDAAIRGFRLPESGTYVIVASRFGQQYGFSIGDFELSITKASSSEPAFGTFSQAIAYGTDVTGTMSDDQLPLLYTFRGSRGDTISVQMVATSGDLDTRVSLMDNLGNTLAFNDDDLLNLSIDSLIQNYVLPSSGYYSIQAFHYTGAANSGDFRLNVTLEQSAAPGEIPPIYAVLNPENSRTLRADGQFFSNFSTGDSLDEENTELRTESLLTFFLPPLPQDAQFESAALDIAPCYETGDGFEALGSLTIYSDTYGSLNQSRDFTRPSSGARILTTLDQCDSLDLSELVRDAYASGTSSIQLRLSFRSPTSNQQADEVLMTPRLLLTLGE